MVCSNFLCVVCWMRDFRSDVVAAMGQSAIVVNQKGLSVAFWPKILAESLSVSAERTFPVSAYLPKECLSAEIASFGRNIAFL